MESWFQRILLGLILALPCSFVMAYEEGSVLEEIINPDLERRELKERKIDTEIFEFGVFAGVMSIEDFGTNDVYGARMALHVTEDVFFELSGGTAKMLLTSAEQFSGDSPPFLSDGERKLTYYDLALGVNLFPGETHLYRRAFHHHLYLVGGGGNTLFGGDEHFTYMFGGGFRLFVTDWISLRMDVRNHVLTHSLFGEEKEVQNLETHLGLSVFF